MGVARFRLICPLKETVNHRTIHARMGKTVLRLALNIIIDPKIRNLVSLNDTIVHHTVLTTFSLDMQCRRCPEILPNELL